jgi:electron transfer flavoprotein alpha subunit
MKILVCIRQGRDGEINPFDACAYEEALKLGGDITIISMGPYKTAQFLSKLTRLGANRAILLSDKAFAGADTLATAYTLSLAVEELNPDLIFCGRQTLEGDTAQVGPMLSVKAGYSLITNVTAIRVEGNSVVCDTRNEGEQKVLLPALVTVERINNLRLPSIRSKMCETEIWSAEMLGADVKKCGLEGSPTRVLKTFENESGKRKCQFVEFSDIENIISKAIAKQLGTNEGIFVDNPLKKVYIVGEKPMAIAKTVSDDITVIKTNDYKEICEIIKRDNPNAVLFASDDKSKMLSSLVAAELDLGLCADCTKLENDNGDLVMYRPALSGSVIGKIKSLTKPALATVRTPDSNRKDVIVSVGYGAKDSLDKVMEFAKGINAEIGASRKMVDNGYMPYSAQIGLTGKTVCPPVYIAIGVSGAVHHIVGFDRSGTVIAINPDKKAPIFDYADYGIIHEF